MKDFRGYELDGWMYECDVQHWCELSDWIDYDRFEQEVRTQCGVRIKPLYFDTNWTGDDEPQFQYYWVISGDVDTVKSAINEVFKQSTLKEISCEEEREYYREVCLDE